MKISSKIPIGFIGAGYMAKEHLKAFLSMSDVEIVGIFSRTRSRAEELASEFNIPIVYESIYEMYSVGSPSAVVVSVPEMEVGNVCNEVFKYPWKSLIEKPVGYNFQDAENIVNVAKKYSHQGFVALNRRHYSSTRAALDLIKNKKGRRLVHVLDQESQEQALLSGQPELVVQNWMYANSIHLIDYFKIFCRGNIESVENLIPWDSVNPLFVMSKINYSSGDVGIYSAAWNAPGPWSVAVNARDIRLELRPLERCYYQEKNSRSAIELETHQDDVAFKPGLKIQAEEFLRACNGIDHNLPTIHDALDTMKLVRLIYET